MMGRIGEGPPCIPLACLLDWCVMATGKGIRSPLTELAEQHVPSLQEALQLASAI
jgi:hypothetical protein